MNVSIAIPTYDDHEGLWGTLATLRAMSQTRDMQIACVDNNPTGVHGAANESACSEFDAVYHKCEIVGNARAKDMCVRRSPTEYVLVMDSHVVLDEGGIDALRSAIEWHGRTALYHGPLRTGGNHYHTHFKDEWGSSLWGVWGDDEVRRKAGVPYEIQAMGMGVFVASRSMWDRIGGFHPDLVGFAGEEWYIHTKYRNHGGRVISVPGLVWKHRFHKPHRVNGPSFGLDIRYKNYVIALNEAGIDLTRLNKEYGMVAAETWVSYVPEGGRVLLDIDGGWDYVYALGRDDLPSCNLQVKDTPEMHAIAVQYAQRVPTAYGGGEYDFVMCNGGGVNAYAGTVGYIACPRVRDINGQYAELTPPEGYWAWRMTDALVVYTNVPANAEPELPSLLRRARNLATSLIAGGVSRATPELVMARRDICTSNGGVCPTNRRRISDNKCSACGCALEHKLSLAGQHCPEGHW